MANEIDLKTFPSTKYEALTLLYLQQSDISNLSPTELVHKYNEIRMEIAQAFRIKVR